MMATFCRILRRSVSLFLFGLPLGDSQLAKSRELGLTELSAESSEKEGLVLLAAMACRVPFSFSDRQALIP